MKVDIVVTTIFEPGWLQGYLDNIRTYGRERDVTLRIICDRKTPASVFEAAAAAAGQGFDVVCPALDEQARYLAGLGLPEDFVPWNSDNRRNIGFLQAWESGAEVLISIDDDNYCAEGSDFVGSHCIVGGPLTDIGGHQYSGGARWFNICSLLESQCRDPIFARGYPYAARAETAQARLTSESRAPSDRVLAINAGLWLEDPDVDAITRLAQRPRVTAASSRAVVLENETWSPINTQNTAVMRAALPAYYYVRMGYSLGGMSIDRFGDILSGYFAQKCAKHLGHAIRFGSPVAAHRRTPHNLFKDLYHELAGVVLVEDLLPWLQDLRLSGDNYFSAYASLADALSERAPAFRGFVWDMGGREFLLETAKAMQIWLKTLAKLGK